MSSFQKVIKYCAIAFAILLVVMIISGIGSAAVSVVKLVSGDKISHNDSRNRVDFTENFTDVDSLNIDISTGEVVIKSGETFRVEAQNVTDNFKAEVSGNGTLNVNENGNSTHFLWFNWSGFGNINAKITVYLPEDFIADEARINMGAGNLTIDNLSTERLTLSAGAGNINGSNITANKVKFDGGVGSVNLNGVTLNDADMDSGVGSLNIEGVLLGDNSINCGVGSVNLDLNGNVDDYDLDIESGVGTVRVNGEKVKGQYHNSNADNSLEVDGGVGNVSIDFAE